CTASDFDRDGFIFNEANENPGRRPFPRGQRHFEMLTMGNAVIISATPDILPYVREQLEGKNRDEAFNMSFVYGVGICYLPDNPQAIPMPDRFKFELIERNDILKLYDICKHDDFPYVFSYDIDHPRPDVLASTAIINGDIVGIAGSSRDCEMMWQIGINVLPDFRKHGIAKFLTNMLAIEILNRGKIPYYTTAPGNIASQRVAISAGFKPAWTCVYRGRFDGELTLPATG
ncbi:MAG: GNAT family N-acetyltransferase, partial [Oscillospiraceae bacterium]|nr:GNAT family N-acetyltransferase [Oscillospiraceae bacterium]